MLITQADHPRSTKIHHSAGQAKLLEEQMSSCLTRESRVHQAWKIPCQAKSNRRKGALVPVRAATLLSGKVTGTGREACEAYDKHLMFTGRVRLCD